ncbi:MAG TPA: Dna2/Cas4 domain-containing protein [Acetobacteraceae bacterium]|nr:Dna2/Cas4 domain-containing protein [Acetobacteraceae bacterium]
MSAIVILALAIIALIAWAHFRGKEKAGALPPGKVTYEDTDVRHSAPTLVSHRYGLVGRPDYVVQTQAAAIPVEVKSRSCGGKGPYPGELAQLYAYCLLVEDVMGQRVAKGVIEFADRKWPVKFGSEQRRAILSVLDEMRSLQDRPDVRRSHAHAGRCRACGFRAPHVCGQALR